MFGLGGEKGKKADLIFDLEQEVQDTAYHKQLIKIVEDRAQQIKGILRAGADKETYGSLGTLLHGYVALLKVIGRIRKV